MPKSGAYTLLAIIVVMVIVGILAAVAIPNYVKYNEQEKAQTAENNLLAIQAAQVKYNEDHGTYCVGAPCADTTADLDTSLYLTISDSFTYSCATAAENIPYNCTATDGTDTLTMDPNANPNTGQQVVSCSPNGCGL